jgi:glucokinase
MIGALDVGGTHVSSALVDPQTWRTVTPVTRIPLDSRGPAEDVLLALVRAADALGAATGSRWGVAMPDPFDYEHGIARFEGVGKFESLFGRDIGAELRARLTARPADIVFLNDANAFLLGEWLSGAAQGATRCAGLTLGTGVGSSSIADGRVVDEGHGVPPGGRAHRLTVFGRPLEETMSRRAVRSAYRSRTGDAAADVAQIAERARRGEPAAAEVLAHALGALGTAIAPWLREFGAQVLVVGGSMTRSWDVFGPLLVQGLGGSTLPIRVSADPEASALVGAARAATDPV